MFQIGLDGENLKYNFLTFSFIIISQNSKAKTPCEEKIGLDWRESSDVSIEGWKEDGKIDRERNWLKLAI